MASKADQFLRGVVQFAEEQVSDNTTQLADDDSIFDDIGNVDWLWWIAFWSIVYAVIAGIAKLAVCSKAKDDDKHKMVDKFLCCWPSLFLGRAEFKPYNFALLPLLLVVHWLRIYVWELIAIYSIRLSWRCCGCCSAYYEDKEFPPNAASLGEVGGDSANATAGKDESPIEWKRLGDFARKTGERPAHPVLHDTDMQLFCGRVEAQDVLQGSLGDCWLLAAMAILAEREGAIDDLFVTKEVSPAGKYVIQLFDVLEQKWVTITVDDHVPCKKGYVDKKTGMPDQIYTRCHQNEVWACMLEKAFAKFCGNYHSIEAGHTEWGLMAMTGKQAFRYLLRGEEWLRIQITGKVNEKDPHDKREVDFLMDHNIKHTSEELWDILRLYHRNGAVLCIQGANDEGEAKGLVKGHAFSILNMHNVPKGLMSNEVFRLVEIRNPWGTGEWKGAWSDGSEEWTKYSHVASSLKIAKGGKDDGIYWMQWEDIIRYWTSIGVVDMDYDIMGLRPPLYNDKELSGPLQSCCKGSAQFCCCAGMKHFLVARKSESSEPEMAEQGCIGMDPSGCYCNCRKKQAVAAGDAGKSWSAPQ